VNEKLPKSSRPYNGWDKGVAMLNAVSPDNRILGTAGEEIMSSCNMVVGDDDGLLYEENTETKRDEMVGLTGATIKAGNRAWLCDDGLYYDYEEVENDE